ncbi:MAG: hypothetical protein FK733_05980 [Asgard group archaeon]|nr:hypothetical protein [Asgard group archaeon]
MIRKRKKTRKKRGYPVAILIGFEPKKAILWEIFSEMVKPLKTIILKKRREKLAENELYNFHEEIIDSIRAHIKDGLRSLIIAIPRNSPFSEHFQQHIKKHHKWLSQEKSTNVLMIGTIEGSASNDEDVSELFQTETFQAIIDETTAKEASNIIEELEERLQMVSQGEVVLYSLQEIEELTYGQWKYGKRQPEYVMLTNTFLKKHKQKQRLHRLLQILNNKKVKTKVIDADTVAGERITQFGGLICFTKSVEN